MSAWASHLFTFFFAYATFTMDTGLLHRRLIGSFFLIANWTRPMSRALFSSGRDTASFRKQRKQLQQKTPVIAIGSILCDTEVDNAAVSLPFKMVKVAPEIFRPTEGGSSSTYYMDMVVSNTQYPLICVENEPRLEKYQPEIRAILRRDNCVMNHLCRTASNLPLDSHPELKKQLMLFLGHGVVAVNLTPPSVSPVVIVFGTMAISAGDNLPILQPTTCANVLSYLSHVAELHPMTEPEEEIFLATMLETPEVSTTSSNVGRTSPLSLKRKRPIQTARPVAGGRTSKLKPRKDTFYPNKETRKAKIARRNEMIST